MPPLAVSTSTGLTITNPLILYRSLLATRQIDPDPAQHRLALHLRNLYFRLKDYSPQVEYGSRLTAISQAVGEVRSEENEDRAIAVPGHPLRRNPLFAHLFSKKEFSKRDTLALTRVLTSHDSAISLNSPRGLLLHGEVGTGKSMMVDLLADSLPNQKKKRWHFSTFMLETISRLELLRQTRSDSRDAKSEYSIFVLAKDLIETSPILFLDEFQLPDRAANKILSNLLTIFFQLGGVLIASSNRMPDELAKASGVEYAPSPSGGLVANWLGLRLSGRGRGSALSRNEEYSGFLEVLKARCEVWDMNGGRDWRRREAEEMHDQIGTEGLREEMIENFTRLEKWAPGGFGVGGDQSLADGSKRMTDGVSRIPSVLAPKYYVLSTIDTEEAWQALVSSAMKSDVPNPVQWQPATHVVYGRRVTVPRQNNDGTTLWTFSELCAESFGPADYITIASKYHTLILDEVPVLTLLQKNEARRLITLLDALYEAKCKLIVRAEAGPDALFFPETMQQGVSSSSEPSVDESDGGNALYSETISEIYQDQTSPFRPNISSYRDEPRGGYDPDEDSDFGPIPGQGNEIGRKVDFGMTSSFTGEDERFAYKRAQSRLWEMCGARWHARSEPGWWKPLPADIRRWEGTSSAAPRASLPKAVIGGDVRLGRSTDLEKPAGLQGKELDAREQGLIEDGAINPWRRKDYPPPKFGETYAWGMTTWGKKAGAWVQGPEGLDRRNRDRKREE